VLGAVTVGVTVAEGVAVVGATDVGETVGVTGVGETVGVTGGVVVLAGVAVGVGVAGDVGAGVVAAEDWTGPMRLGPVMWWPVSISTIASPATATTAITPPVAAPAANDRRSPQEYQVPFISCPKDKITGWPNATTASA
jgi:hypothetical protein